MHLDRTKPYSEVHAAGRPLVYEQGGRFFAVDGKHLPGFVVDIPEDESEEITDSETGELPRIDYASSEPSGVDHLPVISAYEGKPFPVLEAMHWRHLKVMVEQYEGTWTNKENAIKFLRGLG